MRQLVLIIAFFQLLLLSGCSSRQPEFYVLDSASKPLQATTQPRTTLAVLPATLPDYLDRQPIVLRKDHGCALTIPQFSVWGEPLGQGIARVIRERLATPLNSHGITVLPSQDSHVAQTYSLLVDIVHLDAGENGTIRLEARWTLIDSVANKVMLRGSQAQTVKIAPLAPTDSQTFLKAVNEESQLIQNFADILVGRLISKITSVD